MAYVFLIAMVVALVFALPVWPHSTGWGWIPTTMVGVMLATTLLFGVVGGVWSL